MAHNFIYKVVKKENKLIFTTDTEQTLYKKFIEELPDKTLCTMYIEAEGKKASVPQYAKVHKCIRVLANDLGYTFDEMKLLIKDKAGLSVERKIDDKIYHEWKSFADCSVEDLNLAIQACIEIGDEVGSNLR